MDFKIEKDKLVFIINGDLNYQKSAAIEKVIGKETIKEIFLDFQCPKFVDSEGIKLLYTLWKKGFKITLKNPPDLFFEVVKILKLEELLENIEVING